MNDASRSDVIPAVMMYVRRFLSGEFPYTPMRGTHWDHTVIPNYLPLQWLPYSFAELFNIDFRWIPVWAVLLVLGLHYSKIRKSTSRIPVYLLLWALPIVLIQSYISYHETDLQVTVEGLIVAYYMILGYAILSFRIRWIGLALILCLLSRFSLVLWVPLLFVIIASSKGWKAAFRLALIVGIGFLIVLGPFLIKDPLFFTHGFAYYTLAASGEWKIQEWLPPGALYPFQLQNGVGFAIYFFKYIGGDVIHKIEVARHVHLFVSAGVIVLLTIIFLKNRKKINPAVFALGSLKVYLAIFYGFIQVPYLYLYTVPLFLNIPLFFLAVLSIRNMQQERKLTLPLARKL